MNRSAVEVFRAYLAIAGVTAAALCGSSALAALAWHIPDTAFQSDDFRFGAIFVIIGCTLVVKHLAERAFDAALADQQLTLSGAHHQDVEMPLSCPHRGLVLLHLRFHRQRFDSIHVYG